MYTKDIAITSLETITAFHVTTGAYLFTLDELQNATIDQTQETTEITGKGGRKLTSLKRNKAISISGSNGLVSGGLLELQTGSNFKTKASEVMWVDYLTVKNVNGVLSSETKYKATGTEGGEIEGLYFRNTDGTLGDKIEQGSVAAEATEAVGDTPAIPRKFAYDPATKILTFPASVGVGFEGNEDIEIVVYYKRKVQADVLENFTDQYSGKCALYIDAIAEDKCANVYRVQFYIPKADFSGEFSFDMGENQSVHAFSAEALAGACGNGGVAWTYTIFGENTADVA